MMLSKVYVCCVGNLLVGLLLINSTPVESIQGQHYQPGVCVDEYEACVKEPEFKRCNKSALTPRANLTVISRHDGTALLRCVEYNNRNSVYLVPGFSWLQWNQSKTTGNLDIDYGSFHHIKKDDYKYDIQSRLYRQDLHAQYLTIKHLSVDDYGVYTCVICSKYGRSQSNVVLRMGMIRASKAPTFSVQFTTITPKVIPPNGSSPARILPKAGGTAIALFVIGSLVAIMIILGVIYAIRSKILKPSHAPSPQAISGSPFLNDIGDTSKPFHEGLPPRKWSSPSTVTSFLSRGSTSSNFPFFKRNSSSSRSPYSGQMMYITEIADLEDVFEMEPDEAWEIPREHVVLEEGLGEGAFGIVMKATAYGLQDMPSQCTVAVKMVKEDAMSEEYGDFLAEIETMKNIGHHKNIINMLGTCTINGPTLLVVEYAQHGNLRDFLRARRRSPLNSTHQNNNSQESLTIGDLTSYAYQAAKGMEYLASKKCVHRDLAARNVLVAQDYVIKIADFGLSRNVKANDYYRKTTHGRLPIMWLSVEALFDQKYTVMSDVWSYGVLLWEIFTLGSSPYPGIYIEKLFTLLKSGYRMPSPLNCPPEIYALMLRCWSENENERPTMEIAVKELDTVLANSSNVEYLDIIAHMTDISSADTNEITRQTLISELDGQETNV